jgi:hypothetical protein
LENKKDESNNKLKKIKHEIISSDNKNVIFEELEKNDEFTKNEINRSQFVAINLFYF